ncbi:hypothetical protein ACWEV4_32235 [Streptomyces sp. NPDC003860]
MHPIPPDGTAAIYRALTPETQYVLRVAGVLPTPWFTADIIAAACRIPPAFANWHLEILLQEGLATVSAETSGHQLIAAATALAERLCDSADVVPPLRRLGRWATRCARVAAAGAPVPHASWMPPDLVTNPAQWARTHQELLPPLLQALEEARQDRLICQVAVAWAPLIADEDVWEPVRALALEAVARILRAHTAGAPAPHPDTVRRCLLTAQRLGGFLCASSPLPDLLLDPEHAAATCEPNAVDQIEGAGQ